MKSRQLARLLYGISFSESEVYQELIAKRKFGLFEGVKLVQIPLSPLLDATLRYVRGRISPLKMTYKYFTVKTFVNSRIQIYLSLSFFTQIVMKRFKSSPTSVPPFQEDLSFNQSFNAILHQPTTHLTNLVTPILLSEYKRSIGKLDNRDISSLQISCQKNVVSPITNTFLCKLPKPIYEVVQHINPSIKEM